MKITINLTKDEAEHIEGDHSFIDCCGQVATIMLKVQSVVNRLFKKRKIKRRK